MISIETLQRAIPGCKTPKVWAPILSTELDNAGITEPEQIARFLAQTSHESSDFNVLQENLNYSGDRLMAIFPKHFVGKDVSEYNRNPEKIANAVYSNRMGNGDEDSGDGYKYRGRGILQITGRNNYTACSNSIYGDETLVDNPDLVLTPEVALKSALWYWSSNNLNEITDMISLTKKINGGTIGLDDRIARYTRILSSL